LLCQRKNKNNNNINQPVCGVVPSAMQMSGKKILKKWCAPQAPHQQQCSKHLCAVGQRKALCSVAAAAKTNKNKPKINLRGMA